MRDVLAFIGGLTIAGVVLAAFAMIALARAAAKMRRPYRDEHQGA